MSTDSFHRGPAADVGLDNFYESTLIDSLRGHRVRVALITLQGQVVIVEGINTGSAIETSDKLVFPFTQYKVSRFL